MKTVGLSHHKPAGPVHGIEVPALGLGVFQMGSAEAEQAVLWALEAGYRHIDTAALYRNEADIGRALASSPVSRSEVHITTKLWRDAGSPDDVERAFEASSKALGVDAIDLYLVHAPVAGASRQAVWRGMERLLGDGRVRAIGVSNHGVHHLEELLAFADVAPATNQLELTPFLQRHALVAFCREHGIGLTAYSPLTKGRKLGDPRLLRVAKQVGRSPAQVLIRWGLEQGYIVIPKSSRRERIEQNGAVFDFSLPSQVLADMAAWDEGLVTGWDPVSEA